MTKKITKACPLCKSKNTTGLPSAVRTFEECRDEFNLFFNSKLPGWMKIPNLSALAWMMKMNVCKDNKVGAHIPEYGNPIIELMRSYGQEIGNLNIKDGGDNPNEKVLDGKEAQGTEQKEEEVLDTSQTSENVEDNIQETRGGDCEESNFCQESGPCDECDITGTEALENYVENDS